MAENGNGGVFGTANKAIGALSGAPMLLVMVLLNCAFIGAGAYYLRGQQSNAYLLVNRLLDRCLPDVHPEARVLPPGEH